MSFNEITDQPKSVVRRNMAGSMGRVNKNARRLSERCDHMLEFQEKKCPNNAKASVRTGLPTSDRTEQDSVLRRVASFGWVGLDVSCLFFRGQPRQIPDALSFALPKRILRCTDGREVLGGPDFPRSWWKEVRDTSRSDGCQSTRPDPALFC